MATFQLIVLTAIGALLASCQFGKPNRERRIKVAHHEAEHAGKIRPIQKLNPIWWVQNTDDPAPPEWYKPDAGLRLVKWRLRNPFHNFTFYVVGITDRDFRRFGKHPADNFAPDGGFNWAVVQKGPILLPFVSWHGKHLQFYLLWRERGNLGAKLNISFQPKPTPNERKEQKRKEKVSKNE